MPSLAIIDLGTNTFNLLISDEKGQPLYNEKLPVKLGKGGISKGFIAPEAFQRALDAMMYYKIKADELAVQTIIATATSAVRSASNGQELINKINEKTGIQIQVISGDEEAELIYFGVRQALDLKTDCSIIMDIGGGSVEFIICDKVRIFWKQSFEIGAQRMLDLFHKSDPITDKEKLELKTFLQEKLKPVFEAAEKFKPSILVGSSGTYDTLAEIDLQKKLPGSQFGKFKEYTLNLEEYREMSSEIIALDRSQRMKIPGMMEMRVDMIVVACLLINFIIEELKLLKIRISTYSLKEGVLYRALNKDIR